MLAFCSQPVFDSPVQIAYWQFSIVLGMRGKCHIGWNIAYEEAEAC